MVPNTWKSIYRLGMILDSVEYPLFCYKTNNIDFWALFRKVVFYPF